MRLLKQVVEFIKREWQWAQIKEEKKKRLSQYSQVQPKKS